MTLGRPLFDALRRFATFELDRPSTRDATTRSTVRAREGVDKK